MKPRRLYFLNPSAYLRAAIMISAFGCLSALCIQGVKWIFPEEGETRHFSVALFLIGAFVYIIPAAVICSAVGLRRHSQLKTVLAKGVRRTAEVYSLPQIQVEFEERIRLFRGYRYGLLIDGDLGYGCLISDQPFKKGDRFDVLVHPEDSDFMVVAPQS